MNLAPTTIIGNLTSDPELTFTTGGQARLTFGIASSHVWYDQDNEKQDKTSYFNVVAWRYLAEHSARSLEKGIAVVVHGRLEQRSYEDKDGAKRSIVELVADEIGIATKSIETLERRTRQDGAGSQTSAGPRQAQQGQQRRTRPSTSPAMAGSGSDREEPF